MMFQLCPKKLIILIIIARIETLPFNEDAAKRILFTDSHSERNHYMNDKFPEDGFDGITYCVQAISLLNKYDFLDENAYTSAPPKDKVFGYKIEGILHHVSVHQHIVKVCHFSNNKIIIISYNQRPQVPGFFYYKYYPDRLPVKKGIYFLHLWNYLQADLLYRHYGKYKTTHEKPNFDAPKLRKLIENKYVQRLKNMESSLNALYARGISNEREETNAFEEEKKYLRLYRIMVAETKVISSHLCSADRVQLVPDRIELPVLERRYKKYKKELAPACASDDEKEGKGIDEKEGQGDDEKEGQGVDEDFASMSKNPTSVNSPPGSQFDVSVGPNSKSKLIEDSNTKSDSDPNSRKSTSSISQSKSKSASSEQESSSKSNVPSDSHSKSRKSAPVEHRPSSSKNSATEISNKASKSKTIPVEIDSRSKSKISATVDPIFQFLYPPETSPFTRYLKKCSNSIAEIKLVDRKLKSPSELFQLVGSENHWSPMKRPAEDDAGTSKMPRSSRPSF